MKSKIKKLNEEIIHCKKCPRLSKYIRQVAEAKVRRFADEDYWGKPLPGFGDIDAELLIVGLAPAAHGGNRTGRMFTGDSSGDWVAKSLFENGFATIPTSISRNDGFSLINAYITAVVRCAPPQNKPTKDEFENCINYLQSEFKILKKVRVVVCLGRIAFDSCKKILDIGKEDFEHGKIIKLENVNVICSYHPSRQNTQTGRLSWNQWNSIFRKAKNLLR